MGVNSEFLGRVDIVPPLNPTEREYLWRFSRSTRRYRADGPYAVYPEDPEQDMNARNRHVFDESLAAQPSAFCQWVPCRVGCCLAWDNGGRFYGSVDWMRYLIDHFLRSDGEARRSGDPQFDEFTFDHRLDGVIVGEQGDNRELFLIRVENNAVAREVLHRGDVMPWERGYEERAYPLPGTAAAKPKPRRRRTSGTPAAEALR